MPQARHRNCRRRSEVPPASNGRLSARAPTAGPWSLRSPEQPSLRSLHRTARSHGQVAPAVQTIFRWSSTLITLDLGLGRSFSFALLALTGVVPAAVSLGIGAGPLVAAAVFVSGLLSSLLASRFLIHRLRRGLVDPLHEGIGRLSTLGPKDRAYIPEQGVPLFRAFVRQLNAVFELLRSIKWIKRRGLRRLRGRLRSHAVRDSLAQ